MASVEERLATNEQILSDIRDDMRAFTQEQTRTRERVHSVEATTAALVLRAQEAQRIAETRQRRLELRLEVLTVVIALIAIIVPAAQALH